MPEEYGENQTHREPGEGLRERWARMDERVKRIEDRVGNGKEPVFVTRVEFVPVQKVVYGLVFLILTGVVGALISLVIRSR